MKKIFNTPEVNMVKMEAAQVIAASAQGGMTGNDPGKQIIGNGGNTSTSGLNGADARRGGFQNVSASEMDF